MALALALAVAIHALALFAFDMPAADRATDHVRVTLSVTADTAEAPTDVSAATDQTGPDAQSRRGRRASVGADRQAANAPGGGSAPRPTRPGKRAGGGPGQPDAGDVANGGSGARANTTRRTRSARADDRAAYVANWKKRVETTGTRNFPAAALASGDANQLTVAITIRADGGLDKARVMRASGNAELDAAALRIVREAAPYAPFPPDLRRQHERLTFAYVWRFVRDGSARLSVH